MKRFYTLLLIVLSVHVSAKTHYVNQLATGSNNGTSWANAFVDLNGAMWAAVNGDTIKVASGSYSPTNIGYSGINYSFVVNNGICLLGGYPNTGNPSDAQRSWIKHPTILSGVIGGGYTSNTIVLAQNLNLPTLIEGFTFLDGLIGIRALNSSKLLIRNNVFQCRMVAENSQVTFLNCANTAGGMYNIQGSTSFLYNCIFSGASIQNENATVHVTNCTIVNAPTGGIIGKGSGTAIIANSIFWKNILTTGFEDVDIVPNGQTIQIKNSITEVYSTPKPNTLLVTNNPRFLDIRNPAGSDNKFFTADDGLQLTTPCSPGLNYGDNSAVTGINTDILGNPRIYNSGVVDLGAYEMQSTPGTVRTTVFVNNSPSNTGANDGSSWQNAFKTLQAALLYCADTIKVSEGVYLTDNSYKDSTFLIENGKVIIGGYPAIGNPGDADRNPLKYITTLKANYFGTGLAKPVLRSYNSDSTTIVDGITFWNYAGPTSGHFSILISHESRLKIRNCNFAIDSSNGRRFSGILVTKKSSATISNSSFLNRTGGNMFVRLEMASHVNISFCSFLDSATGFRSPFITVFNSTGVIDSCVFFKKWGEYSNPAMISSENGHLEFSRSVFHNDVLANQLISYKNTGGTFSNCIFKNKGSGYTLGITHDNSSPVYTKCFFDSSDVTISNIASAPVFNNCVSINAKFMNNRRSTPVLNHCTVISISRVSTYNLGLKLTASEGELISNVDSSVLRANNTIFWSDKLRPGAKDLDDRQGSTSILTNCLTQNFGTDGVNGNKVGHDPRFVQQMDIDGPDNVMFTADDGIRLAHCSPAIDAGNNSAGVITSSDILNNQRNVNGVVDIGAYESQSSTGLSNKYFVNANARGANTGVDWQNAYTDLQQAVCNPCADTIKVAAGIYKPAIKNRDSTFFINRPISMFGGYPSTGNPGDAARDPLKYPTILSGNIGDPNDSLDNSAVVILATGVPDSIIIDGFTIQDAYSSTSPFPSGLFYGAGILTYQNHLVVRNSRFTRNHAFPGGGGISIGYNSSASINNCIFESNTGANWGGALACLGLRVNITNSVFDNNSSHGQGGALHLLKDFELSNCLFYQNHTTSPLPIGRGGAVYAAGGARSGTLFNCTFFANRTVYNSPAISEPAGGGLFWLDPGTITLRNSIFSSNTTGGSSTVRAADFNFSSNVNLMHCITQYDYSFGFGRPTIGYGNFLDSTNPKGPDGIWMTPDDGLQLNHGSPAIDTGTNNLPSYLTTDLLRNNRIMNGKVDLGPYEFSNKPVAYAGRDTIVCAGKSIQLGRAGNPNHTYTWSSNPIGFTSSSASPVVSPSVTTTYFLAVTDGSTVASDTVIVSVTNTLTPSVTIVSSATTICQGTNVSFTATVVNAGPSPTYQWLVNNSNVGTNSSVFTSSALANGSEVKVVVTGTGCSTTTTATSNSVVITVNARSTPFVSISTPASTVCAGSNVVFTATVQNGGTAPSYQWQKNGVNVGTNLDTYSSNTFANGDVVSVILTSNASCVSSLTDTSNSIVVTIASVVSPSVTISGITSVTAGNPAALTSTVGNGGTNPTYLWEDSTSTHHWQPISGATGSLMNYTPVATGVKVRCRIVSNSSCASPNTAVSNVLTFTVTSTPPPVTPPRTAVPADPGPIYYYPNPVRTTLTIDSLNVDFRWQTFEIVSIDGRQRVMTYNIQNMTQAKIYLGMLKNGIYIGILTRRQGAASKIKIIKQ